MMKSKELKTKISHAHSLILSHTLTITCTFCYDESKGIQDQDLFSCSFSDSLSLPYFPTKSLSHYLTAALPHRVTISLQHYLTASLSHCSTTSPRHCVPISLPHCLSDWLFAGGMLVSLALALCYTMQARYIFTNYLKLWHTQRDRNLISHAIVARKHQLYISQERQAKEQLIKAHEADESHRRTSVSLAKMQTAKLAAIAEGLRLPISEITDSLSTADLLISATLSECTNLVPEASKHKLETASQLLASWTSNLLSSSGELSSLSAVGAGTGNGMTEAEYGQQPEADEQDNTTDNNNNKGSNSSGLQLDVDNTLFDWACHWLGDDDIGQAGDEPYPCKLASPCKLEGQDVHQPRTAVQNAFKRARTEPTNPHQNPLPQSENAKWEDDQAAASIHDFIPALDPNDHSWPVGMGVHPRILAELLDMYAVNTHCVSLCLTVSHCADTVLSRAPSHYSVRLLSAECSESTFYFDFLLVQNSQSNSESTCVLQVCRGSGGLWCRRTLWEIRN